MRSLVALFVVWASWAGAREAPASSEAGQADLSTYVAALLSVAGNLEAFDLEDARREGAALRTLEYEWEGERLGTDGALLLEVAGVRDAEEAQALAPRVRALAHALAASSGRGSAPAAVAVDVSALAARDPLVAGGNVQRVEVEAPAVPERIALVILEGWDALAAAVVELWDRFWAWIERLWPRKALSLPGGGVGPLAIGFVVAVALLLAVLSVRALRRRGRASPSSLAVSLLASVRDEDPLSRESDEWERHAQALGTAGRWREAIRAWYHAVLVASFRAGLLQYRKGRTNWEYASRLGVDVAWRPSFQDLTRLFDREWYGRPASDAEAHGLCARSARSILRGLRRPGGGS